MNLVAALGDFIAGLPPVSALVADRVYSLTFGQEPEWPAIRLQLVGHQEDPHLRGSTGLIRARVQVDCGAQRASGTDPFGEAHAVADAVHGEFSGGAPTGLAWFTGAVGGSPGVSIAFCHPQDKRELFDADELNIVRVTQDYLVAYRE